MSDPRREIWLKVTERYAVQMAVIGVRNGKCLVSASSLAAFAEGGTSSREPEETWTITYELMVEVLKMNEFRLWETRDVPREFPPERSE